MKIQEVAKLSPVDRLCYWIRERHNIYLRRLQGKPKPWTDDEILQSIFFTNPYRENDKVTVWFRDNIREPLRDRPEVLFATVCFRWFNLPEPTGRVLMSPFCSASQSRTLTPLGRLMLSLCCNWDPNTTFHVLDGLRKEKKQIFTGAFMINSPPGQGKLEAIVERITNVWEDRKDLVDFFYPVQGRTMQKAHERLTKYPGMGGFMAYEVVCDLRYTYLLENATDKLTWCNPGPGAIRGMCRILGIPFDASNNSTSPPCPPGFQEECQKLLKLAQRSSR